MKKKLLVVILTWNDFKNTSECINSILHSDIKDTEILLIDNNSSDGSNKQLIKKYKFKNAYIEKNATKINLIFIQNKNNLGCGLGHNPGYEYAMEKNFEYVARIDNDMTVSKDLFSNMIKFLDNNKNIAAVSPKILYYKNPKKIWWMGCQIGNALKFQTNMRDYGYNLIDSPNLNGVANTDAIAGCASFMRVNVLKKSKLSDPDFFYGPEDIELSYRLKKFGDLKVNLDVKIYHKVTQSFKSHHKPRRIYFEYKYRLLLIKKIGSFSDKFFGYVISIIKYILYCLLFYNLNQRNKIIPVGRALIHFFIFRRLGEYDRKFNSE
jgi:GT2 family glycosyltransferase